MKTTELTYEQRFTDLYDELMVSMGRTRRRCIGHDTPEPEIGYDKDLQRFAQDFDRLFEALEEAQTLRIMSPLIKEQMFQGFTTRFLDLQERQRELIEWGLA